ncbi:hypothetical protein CD178_03233 (plasmid) [Komagataeibacter saccharivorans]|uniref:Uncharacterized protein n=1 Tax=Komagataeibacter saccharivorans TaxID=265959 RepID=A0A347WGI4_9PROT|nr:hypothetical protein CD178_03233 [Komagataeibacter saccharivorans]
MYSGCRLSGMVRISPLDPLSHAKEWDYTTEFMLHCVLLMRNRVCLMKYPSISCVGLPMSPVRERCDDTRAGTGFLAHNPKAVGSNPAPATRNTLKTPLSP